MDSATEAMVDTVATTARGRLRLMPTMGMVAMEATVDMVTTMARGRLRLMPTIAMVDMEDTDTAMEDMVAMEAMVDTVITTARGRLRLMPTMAATMVAMAMADTAAMADMAMAMVDMVDMVDTDTTVRGRLTCWPRFKMTFCLTLKHTGLGNYSSAVGFLTPAAEYLVQNMNLNQLPSTVEASPYPSMDMVRSTDMDLQNTQHC